MGRFALQSENALKLSEGYAILVWLVFCYAAVIWTLYTGISLLLIIPQFLILLFALVWLFLKREKYLDKGKWSGKLTVILLIIAVVYKVFEVFLPIHSLLLLLAATGGIIIVAYRWNSSEKNAFWKWLIVVLTGLPLAGTLSSIISPLFQTYYAKAVFYLLQGLFPAMTQVGYLVQAGKGSVLVDVTCTGIGSMIMISGIVAGFGLWDRTVRITNLLVTLLLSIGSYVICNTIHLVVVSEQVFTTGGINVVPVHWIGGIIATSIGGSVGLSILIFRSRKHETA